MIQSLEKIRDNYLKNGSPSSTIQPTVLQELEQLKDSYATLQETTRESVIQSRIGQGLFRTSLIHYWQGCSVTGCEKIELLRASHIKPWRYSSNEERLDVFNGLLLLPNLDACFDVGLISFNESGEIIISSELNKDTLSRLGINSELRLLRVEQKHKDFLRYHREHIFRL
ncbi:MAG: HNH endonuclease [Chloroflexota bacterium]